VVVPAAAAAAGQQQWWCLVGGVEVVRAKKLPKKTLFLSKNDVFDFMKRAA
jgi:hypothetical protein